MGRGEDKGKKHHFELLENQGYKVGKTIGSGSYSVVKYGLTYKGKRSLAIKIISKKTNPAKYVDKFLHRELEVVRRVNHKNIIEFIQSIETNNRVYVIMELAPNGDILKVLKREEALSEPLTGFWFHQLVEAMEYCHAINVVHRDLKCEHLLLDGQNNLKLADFGFSRIYGDGGNCHTFCGSFAYSAPEILQIQPYCPKKADIWSMGVILFVLVTGLMPFDHYSRSKLLKQIFHPPVYPDEPSVSKACKRLVLRILQVEPKRYSMRDIKEDSWFKSNNPEREAALSTLRERPKSMVEKELAEYQDCPLTTQALGLKPGKTGYAKSEIMSNVAH